MDIDISRHASVFDPQEHPYCMHVIGAGATGSHVFASLVNLGVENIRVYDPDVVEAHNLANQIYGSEDIGYSKVDACRRYFHNKTGVLEPPDTMKFVSASVTKQFIEQSALNAFNGVVFLLTDTMDSRREIFNALTSSTASAPLLVIETRMASTHGSVLSINPYSALQRAQWVSTLVDDSDEDAIELSPCGTSLSVGPTAALIANYAVWQMMQFFVDPLALQPRVDLYFKPTLTITSKDIAA